MRLSGINLNLLLVFDAVESERNLTRAAEVLNVTQPAVSNALARLRRLFGDPLFVATPEGMAPTPLARDMAGRIRRALRLMESCLDVSSPFEPQSARRTVMLSFTDLAEALLLPALMSRLMSTAPALALRSYYVPRSELPQELGAGSLDLAVDVPLVNDTSLSHEPLLRAEYGCAVRRGHPILRSRRRPSLERYLSLGHVHVSSRRRGIGVVEQSLRQLGHRRTLAVRVRDYTAAAHIVEETDLACAMPKVLARRSGLQVVALPFEVPPLEMHLYWHRSADADPMGSWLRSEMKAVAEAAQKTGS